MKKYLLFFYLCCGILTANAQVRNDDVYEMPEMRSSNVRKSVNIPDFGGYYTMKCDLHTHTVFSDGSVWPDTRVVEAWQHGLDAIAITDHLEGPHRDLKSKDRNESYKIARKKGDEIRMIVIQGTEITRSKPFGHMNALFITDANALAIPDSMEAINIAIKQGGFIQWNHPGWPDNKSTLYPVHEQMIKEKKIHAVEVFNYDEYYPVCFDWCKNMNLAFTGNSDVHELITEYGTEIRPMTLVFASERTEKGIKEALFAGRSAAYFNGMLAGRAEHLRALVRASLEVKTINTEKGVTNFTNHSDIAYTVVFGNERFVFPAGKTIRVRLPQERKATVLNCFTGMNENLTIDF